MKLVELLTHNRILVPLEAETLEEGVALLLETLDPSGHLAAPDHPESDAPGIDAAALLSEVGRGEGGEIRSISPRTRVIVLREGDRPAAALGVSREPLRSSEAPDREPEPVNESGSSEGDALRVLLVLKTGPGVRISTEKMEHLMATLSDPEVESALLTADSRKAVLAIQRLMTLPLVGKMRVSDYLSPMSYRIYPDTPIGEVADLMARKNLSAVPVVGEGLQVLGIITSGEALRQALQGRGKAGASMAGILARDVMSRAVLCVTEDQDLVDAGKMMANRDLAQLPVVREGEMVGFLTREAVLRALLSDFG